MKKLLFMVVASCALFNPLILSAQKTKQQNSPKPIALKTEADSLSYAFGVMMANNGIRTYLAQMGLLADTAAFKSSFETQIENESNAQKKAELRKKMAFKLDSLTKMNAKNSEEFLGGFKEAMTQTIDKKAFYVGITVGNQFSEMSKNITDEMFAGEDLFNKDVFISAMESGVRNEKMLLDDASAEEMLQTASEKAKEAAELKKSEGLKEQYASEIAEGEQFLAENKTKSGVVTLPSGLQYKIIKEGSGKKPTSSDRVKVDYVGTLINGDQFDSSIERGEPAVFGVTQVIKGWTEVLQLMPVGSKWIVYVPYNLAYGSRDTGSIKPYSTLIFEIELLSIEE